jgi:hypothetical protein
MIFGHKIENVAGTQLLEAMLWYESKRSGLGDELYLCFEEGLNSICRNPFFEDRYKGLRVYNIHRFPYQIIYSIEVETIMVVAFFHAKRNPEIWKSK